PPQIWQVTVTADPVAPPSLVFEAPDVLPVYGELGPSDILPGDWSPDGQRLLFWVGPLNASSAAADGVPLYLFDTITQQATLLADTALLNPHYHSWSPDGSALAYTAGGYWSAQVNKWLKLWDSKTSQITTVVSVTQQTPGIVAWSPRGDWIAYAAVPANETNAELADWGSFDNPAIAGRRIYLLNPDTGETQRLNNADALQDAPIWSEDGATLYYVQRDGAEVVLMAADPATSQATPIEASRQPLPDYIGYYGQGEWDQVLKSIPPLPPVRTNVTAPAVIIPATANQLPTFPQDLLFVNQEGVQYWNHTTNQISTLIAPTLGAGPGVTPIVERQAGPGLPIGTITELSVSDSGQKIAFVRYTGLVDGQEQYRIDLYDRAAAQTTIVVPLVTRLFDMTLSADGEWVAYLMQATEQTANKPSGLAAPIPAPHSGDGPPLATVWVVPTNGLAQPNQVGLCGTPVSNDVTVQCERKLLWSASNQLAWADSTGLWLATTDANSATLLAANTFVPPTSIQGYTPGAWSPSGRYLLTWVGHYEGGSQAIIDSKTTQVAEVANSFEYVNPGLRLTWLADDRIALVRPGSLYDKIMPTLEFWSLRDGVELQLQLDLSVTIPITVESIPTAPFPFPNGSIGFAVLNSHQEQHQERGLFIWDQKQIQRVNALPLSAENPAMPGLAILAGELYWSSAGAGAILQDFDFGYLLYAPTDGTPLYDLKALMGDYVWGITWLRQ
ncbi:MAG: TolB family protein, partial [Caldilineaceae bacterium]